MDLLGENLIDRAVQVDRGIFDATKAFPLIVNRNNGSSQPRPFCILKTMVFG